MNIIGLILAATSCLYLGHSDPACVVQSETPQIKSSVDPHPTKTGEAVDVILSAQAALVWDETTGEILYQKNADVRRPIASVSKLLTVLMVRDVLAPTASIEIGSEAIAVQRYGAHIKLPRGEHASMIDLMQAALVASANDAAVALAVGAFGSQEALVAAVPHYGPTFGVLNTKLANATGLSGGEQYSTATDVKRLLQLVYSDPLLRPFLADTQGVLTTKEGSTRSYKSTNKLLGTYLPILAAKTGYTVEAGQNLTLVTQGPQGQTLGVVVLGSEDRFQDAKVLVQWVWRNYTWQ